MVIIDQLRKIKIRYPHVWLFLEKVNGSVLKLFSANTMMRMKSQIVNCILHNGYTFKNVENQDAEDISKLLSRADMEDAKYFSPFDFDIQSILHVCKCGTYLCFKVVINDSPVGFFFLRISFTRKSFLGFYIDKAHRGIGLGKKIIYALAEACVENGLAIYSSVSELNVASMKTHESNGFLRIRKSNNGYWLLGIDATNFKRKGAVI